MEQTLRDVGINAVRHRGKQPQEIPSDYRHGVMRMRTPGAIGCHLGQCDIMREGLAQNKDVIVMEDDLQFCADFKERIPIIEEFLSTHEWDIFWLGATFHKDPPVWHAAGHPETTIHGKCECSLNVDWTHTDHLHFVQTYGIWSTYAYIVNIKSVAGVLMSLDNYIYESIGIDWLMIKLQPRLLTYCMIPGCVKQYDNLSDIGIGMTVFSNFKTLGPYWYQEYMNDLNLNEFYGR
jgi:GR25 family glycosyltransferase involved in LPS biosynthesis